MSTLPKIDLNEVKIELAKRNIISFTQYTMGEGYDGKPRYKKSHFHEMYCSVIDKFADGIIKKLMVTVPPQHGKSEISTRRLPAYIFGKDPNRKIAITSYNTVFARKFNRDVQRIIDTKEYRTLYPDTKINGKNVVTVNSYLRNADEFEIVNHRGFLKAVGRGGALTGTAIDTLIIDDIYKDDIEANSPIIRDNVTNWYDTVAESRLHNDSQQLIVFTRWHEGDLIGHLEKKEEVKVLTSLDQIDSSFKGWYKINFQAIKEDEPTEIDPREKGVSLWESRHSLEKLQGTKKRNPEKFECLYQGNPESSEGYLYQGFKTYNKLPKAKQILNYTDTADAGQDYLCSINYIHGEDDNFYVTDLVYTQENMDITKQWVIDLLERGKVNKAVIESNNGGRLFASNVKELVKNYCVVKWFHQSGNKESRIYSLSDMVQERIYFPADWGSRWSEFYNHVTRFKKVFKANKHDDAVDVLTGIIEQHETPKKKGRRTYNIYD